MQAVESIDIAVVDTFTIHCTDEHRCHLDWVRYMFFLPEKDIKAEEHKPTGSNDVNGLGLGMFSNKTYPLRSMNA